MGVDCCCCFRDVIHTLKTPESGFNPPYWIGPEFVSVCAFFPCLRRRRPPRAGPKRSFQSRPPWEMSSRICSRDSSHTMPSPQLPAKNAGIAEMGKKIGAIPDIPLSDIEPFSLSLSYTSLTSQGRHLQVVHLGKGHDQGKLVVLKREKVRIKIFSV